MNERQHNIFSRILRIVAEVVVAVYVVADSAVSFVFQPVVRFLSRLKLVQRIERGIDALPPYVILVLMVVPFAIAELAKVFAVFWMSEGHLRTGMTIFIGAYIVSIFVCERILHAGKRKLMTIRWFAVCYDFIMMIRDRIFGWFQQTAVWRSFERLKTKVRAFLVRTQAALGQLAHRPRGVQGRR